MSSDAQGRQDVGLALFSSRVLTYFVRRRPESIVCQQATAGQARAYGQEDHAQPAQARGVRVDLDRLQPRRFVPALLAPVHGTVLPQQEQQVRIAVFILS